MSSHLPELPVTVPDDHLQVDGERDEQVTETHRGRRDMERGGQPVPVIRAAEGFGRYGAR